MRPAPRAAAAAAARAAAAAAAAGAGAAGAAAPAAAPSTAWRALGAASSARTSSPFWLAAAPREATRSFGACASYSVAASAVASPHGAAAAAARTATTCCDGGGGAAGGGGGGGGVGFEGGVWAAASAAAAAVAAVAVGTGPPRAARCEAHAGADLNTSAGAGARPAGEGQNEASEAAGGAGGRPAPGPTLLTLEQRKRIFFLYEQKIRMLSSLEKVFEYFASEEGEGEEETLMTPLDLVHACVPVHQPTESFETRTGFLQGEPNAGSGGRGGGVGSGRHDDDEYAGDDVSSFFARFADGGSGLIDYPGYLFFLTILSVPPSHVRTLFRLFDLDGNGVVTRDEFAAVLKILRGDAKHSSIVREGQPLRSGLGSKQVSEGGLVSMFFGEDGKDLLTLERFETFIEELDEALTLEEFKHYDVNRDGSICLQDFAYAMTASMPLSKVSKYLDLAERLSAVIPGANGKGTAGTDRANRVTYEQFREAAKLRRNCMKLKIAVDCYQTRRLKTSPPGGGAGGASRGWFGARAASENDTISRADLEYIMNKACGAKLSARQLDVLIFLFDIDGKGHLSTTEFLEAMGSRAEFLLGYKPQHGGLLATFECFRKCATRSEDM